MAISSIGVRDSSLQKYFSETSVRLFAMFILLSALVLFIQNTVASHFLCSLIEFGKIVNMFILFHIARIYNLDTKFKNVRNDL